MQLASVPLLCFLECCVMLPLVPNQLSISSGSSFQNFQLLSDPSGKLQVFLPRAVTLITTFFLPSGLPTWAAASCPGEGQ